jgi:copper chaperone CopZ
MKYTLKIDGMMCGMCESHMNDAIRNNFDVKKVKSSHSKGTTVIECDAPLDEARLKEVVDDTGYDFLGLEKE